MEQNIFDIKLQLTLGQLSIQLLKLESKTEAQAMALESLKQEKVQLEEKLAAMTAEKPSEPTPAPIPNESQDS